MVKFFSKIIALFISPDIFATLRKEQGIWLGLSSLIVSLVIVYALIFSIKTPTQISEIDQWLSWFENQVELITFDAEQNIIKYKTNSELPLTTTREDFTLVVTEDNRTTPDRYETSLGAIFTPEKVLVWMPESGKRYVIPLIDKGKVMDNMTTADFFSQAQRMDRNYFSFFAYSTLFIIAFAQTLGSFFYVLLSILFILFVRRLLNGRDADGMTFSNMFNLYCYISIPPMALAAVYSSLPNPFVDFGLAFMSSLFIYLIFVVRRYLIPMAK